MEELREKLESITPELTRDELDKRFPKIAEFLMKNYGIEVNGNVYYLNEIEFYYYNSNYDDNFNPYQRITPVGYWFFHSSGIDLSFKSNKDEGFGGGILIRSIKDVKTKKTIKGPKKCYEELWDENINALEYVSNPKIIRMKEREINIISTLRIRPKVKNENKWRFIVEGEEVSK